MAANAKPRRIVPTKIVLESSMPGTSSRFMKCWTPGAASSSREWKDSRQVAIAGSGTTRCGLSRAFGDALFAVAANFGAGDGDLHFKIARNLFFQLFVKTALKFADFAATQAGDVDMIA